MGSVPLPADDAALRESALDLDALAARWHEAMSASPMTAEAMRGADHRAQRLGVSGWSLMTHAGAAVAAAVRALLLQADRWGSGPILVLAGPGNNGGDGSVAAWFLAGGAGSGGAEAARVAVVLVATESRPGTPDAVRAWDRLERLPSVTRLHAATAHEMALVGHGIEKASIVVDALLGTGVRGELREPIRAAVELIHRARAAGVPVVSVDTPTAIDLSSGDPSDPVVRADVTITFHRPKTGLLTRRGAALAGRVLVAPIGIPPEADPA